MIISDLHVHSTFSDGRLTIPELVDFYGSRGFGCIAITDHVCEEKTFIGRAANCLDYSLNEATFPLYMAILKTEAERAMRQYQMVVLPGFEISKNSWSNHRSAHILGIGVSRWISADGDIKEIARWIRDQGALAIAAHPVSTKKFEAQTYHLWSRREELRHEFDAWEVASGPHMFPEVLASGLPMIATSDFHRPQQIESWKTLLYCERNPESILRAVREQKVQFTFYKEGITDDNTTCDMRSDVACKHRALDSRNLGCA
jgi:predicted metal-dependent phosphoesterase TrpH